MNSRTIKTTIKQSSISLDEVIIEKAYQGYSITLRGGLSDADRQEMTGDEVNEYRRLEQEKLQDLAGLFNVTPGMFGIFVKEIR